MSCRCSTISDAAERQFSEKRAAKDLAQYRANGPASTSRLLLDGLAKVARPGGLLLDIGSGIGALMFELLDRGTTRAVGIDLSSAYIEAASKEAWRRGRGPATQFVHGDFISVAGELPCAEVVTLDRVVCCYPGYERLLDESVRHSNHCIALSYPRDVWYVRAWVALQNVGRKLVRNSFRTYVHSAGAMQARIQRAHFELRSRSATRTWCADVYVKSC